MIGKALSAPGRWARPVSVLTYFGTAISLVTLFVVWSNATFFLWYNAERSEQQWRASARAIASTIATTLGRDWTGEAAKESVPIVQSAAGQPAVAFVRVRLPNGAVLSSAGDVAIDPQRIWLETARVVHFNQEQGTVEVAILRAAGANDLAQWTRVALGLSGLATLVCAAAAFVVAFVGTQPIRVLQEAAARWEEPLEVRPEQLGGPREVVRLGTAMLQMRTAALVRKAELEAQVAQRTHELTMANAELEASFRGTAVALAQALDARDKDTAFHALRTAELTGRIADRLNLPAELRRTIVLAASLHDIGKIGVPEGVLLKRGPLTDAEYAVMKAHTVIGAHILEPVPGMYEVAEIVRHHHERWDGHGYPDGLAGQGIPLGSRIIAVCDTLEAMCSRRSYRDPLPMDKALAEIRRCSGSQFDPAVVAAGWAEVMSAAEAWSRRE